MENWLNTSNKIDPDKCYCWSCIKDREESVIIFLVCPVCGNKRCPKASNHRLECTGSNEPGQSGSVYE